MTSPCSIYFNFSKLPSVCDERITAFIRIEVSLNLDLALDCYSGLYRDLGLKLAC